MMDSDDDSDEHVVPLGKGTVGLGPDSDRAIRDYIRRAQRSWRERKRDQAREKAFERERLNQLVENAAKQRALDREQEQLEKELYAEKLVAQRKEGERALRATIEQRRCAHAQQILRDRDAAKTRREKHCEERRVHREREILARKRLFEIERRNRLRDLQDQEQARQEAVTVLKSRAEMGRQMLQHSVERALRVKREAAARDKAVQRKKELARGRRLRFNEETLKDYIKELSEADKKRRVEMGDSRENQLELHRMKWKNESQTLQQTTRERREVAYKRIKECHAREYSRELQRRQHRQTYFSSLLFRGGASPSAATSAAASPQAIGHARPHSAPAGAQHHVTTVAADADA